MDSSMYDAYKSVGKKPTDPAIDTKSEEVVEEEVLSKESISDFVRSTISSIAKRRDVELDDTVVEEEVVEEEVVEDVTGKPDYIAAFTSKPVESEYVIEEELEEEDPEEEEYIDEDQEEEEISKDEPEEEEPDEEPEEVVEEVSEDEDDESVLSEEEEADISAFVLETIQAAVNKSSGGHTNTKKVKRTEKVEKDVDNSSAEEEDLSAFVRRTIAEQAKAAVKETEQKFEEEASTIKEDARSKVKSKHQAKSELDQVNKEKSEALAAIKERKENIDVDTIADTLLQLELADIDADDESTDSEFDPESGDKRFKQSINKLKKELKKNIKELFKEEQIATAKRLESMSGGGSGGGINNSTLETNNITSYRCDLQGGYYYSGWLQDGVTIFIKRTDGDDGQFATDLTDLETDWANRVNLNYI